MTTGHIVSSQTHSLRLCVGGRSEELEAAGSLQVGRS